MIRVKAQRKGEAIHLEIVNEIWRDKMANLLKIVTGYPGETSIIFSREGDAEFFADTFLSRVRKEELDKGGTTYFNMNPWLYAMMLGWYTA